MSYHKTGTRFLALLALVVLAPFSSLADVKWRKFDVSLASKQILSVGGVSVTIQVREVRGAAFREDNLLLVVRASDGTKVQRWFSSSYGIGEIAVEGKLLLLRYGVGRGTLARTHHVKVFQMEDFEEVADVQSSYYAFINPKDATPDLMEYRVNVSAGLEYTTVSFVLARPQKGLPSEKLVRIRKGH